MIRYYKKANGQLTELQNAEPSCWINISPPFSHEELEAAAQQFDIPLDFLTDSLDIDERSRYEIEEDVRLIVVNTPILNENEEENEAIYVTVPIGIILTPDYFITIASYENPVLELFLNNKVKNFKPDDEKLFVLQILEQNVYRFLTCLKKLNLKRNLIEKELYDSSRNKELKAIAQHRKKFGLFCKHFEFKRTVEDENEAD